MRSIVNHFRYLRSSKAFVVSFFVVALMLTGVGVYQFNQTSAEAAGDCGTNSIVASGTHSYGDITRHYNANTCGDFRAIYDHYWIKPTVQPGDRVLNGVANNRGEVVADGRVVANNASSIGRTPIKYSHPISIAGKTYYETSHVNGQAFANPGGSLEVIVVLDSAGNFKYSVIKACGNPIYARPVPPPKPPVKNIQVCELATKKIITIREDQFNPQLHSKNLQDCAEKTIQVCELATKQWVTIKESEFNPSKYSKNPEDCKEVVPEYKCTSLAVTKVSDNTYKFETGYSATNATFKSVSYNVTGPAGTTTVAGMPNSVEYVAAAPGKYTVQATVTFTAAGKDVTAGGAACAQSFEIPTPPPEKLVVCDLTTKQVITIDKNQFDSSKHSTNLKDCEEKCPIPGQETLPKNSPDCVQPPATPVELPKTGAGDIFGAGIGLAAMGLAIYYYAASRRIL